MSGASIRCGVAVATLCALIAPAVCAAPVDDAVQNVAAEAAEGIVAKAASKKHAVMPLAGDSSGRVASALITELVRRDVIVVNRDESVTQGAMAELMRTGSDLTSDSAAPQFGRLLVADAVLTGRVTEWQVDGDGAVVAADLKDVSVETGDYFWADNNLRCEVLELRVWVVRCFIVALAVVVVGVATRYVVRGVRNKRRDEHVDGKSAAATKSREGAARALQSAKSSLAAARDEITKAGRTESARPLRDIENDLDVMRKRVEAAATGRPDTMNEGQAGAAAELDNSLFEDARRLKDECGELAQSAIAGSADELTERMGGIRMAIHSLGVTLDERGDKLAGL